MTNTGNWTSFNVNGTVRVRLTDVGKRRLIERRQELSKSFPGLKLNDVPAAVRLDSEGFMEFQMWELMQQMGDLCGNGFPVPFETDIQLRQEASRPADVPLYDDPATANAIAMTAAARECVEVIGRLPEAVRPRAAQLVGDLFNLGHDDE